MTKRSDGEGSVYQIRTPDCPREKGCKCKWRAAFIVGYKGKTPIRKTVTANTRTAALARLREAYDLPFDRLCMHEFVLSARNLKREHGVTALDVAKRLMDYGFHPPTIYFPLVVPEALMIEPTETETKERLDEFVEAMRSIAAEATASPETLKDAPLTRPVRRLDEVKAAKQPVVRYAFDDASAPDRIETA